MESRARLPLVARDAQIPRPRLKMSKQRTYGKQKGTAASRVLLREGFVNENEVEERLRGLSLGTPVDVPTSSPLRRRPVTSPARPEKEEEKKAKASFSAEVPKPQAEATIASPGAVEPIDELTTALISPLLSEAGPQKSLTSFSSFADSLTRAFRVVKLAEGSYGEVYKLLPRTASKISTSATSILDRAGGCILKVVPLKDGSSGRGRGQSNFSSVGAVTCEVKLLKKMDEVVGFARFRGLNVVRGKYPPSFIKAFRDFRAGGGECLNQDPEEVFNGRQLFAVIEMDDAGTDLEQLKDPSVFQIYDIFWSTAVTLAVAEEQVQFEHRDLHVGNICVKPVTTSDGCTSFIDSSTRLTPTMTSPPKALLGLSGLRTTIIDYTFSRATLSLGSNSDSENIAYDPMKDASLFRSVGEGFEQTLQFDSYRQMRTCVNAGAKNVARQKLTVTKTATAVHRWSLFVPQTNVVWLNYLLQVLLKRANNRITPGSSAVAQKLQRRMYGSLEAVAEALDDDDNGDPTSRPKSARQLVEVAQADGWLRVEDILALKGRLEEEEEGEV